jgi:predicted alpha/beta-fold hydrolase
MYGTGSKFVPAPAKGTKKYGLKGGCVEEYVETLYTQLRRKKWDRG